MLDCTRSRRFGDGRVVESIQGKACSKLFAVPAMAPPSLSSSSSSSSVFVRAGRDSPFSGLIICVTGLSKEARKQVRDATEGLGGQYSPDLHPQCTHLVVQSSGGRKLEHALKHGSKKGLFVVKLGWFVDSVRRNVRMSESLYSMKNVGQNVMGMDNSNQLRGLATSDFSCLPNTVHENTMLPKQMREQYPESSQLEHSRRGASSLFGHTMYVDIDISDELRNKVIQAATMEGATFLDQWFVGCNSSYVVCEGSSIQKYVGHTDNVVTPFWVLKTVKEKHVQRLVHMSADLARKIGTVLLDFQNVTMGEEATIENLPKVSFHLKSKISHEERQAIVTSAKTGVRNRRACRMQTGQTPMRPITPCILLDSIGWAVSEPTSTASIIMDSSGVEDVSEQKTSILFNEKGDGWEFEGPMSSFSRPLTESEKTDLVFRNHFLTILFPVDRFGEMGPSSRTFFGAKGFTCLQVLDHIYAFYQENMSVCEIEAAIHTDSRHADCLRSVYSSRETTDLGFVKFKRVDFLGSRRSFEMLKRVGGDNNNNVYELLIRA